MTRSPFPALLTALALALPIGPLHAGNLEEIVVTASRAEQQLGDVKTNVSVVSGETLDLVGHSHINESMQRVPGAWISRGNGQEHLTSLRSPVLTGAGACGAFLMMQDGIPLRSSGFCNVNELFDANTEQASVIEVIKGPASVVYGSNAMHGMINVLTPDVAPVARITVEAGPHSYYRGKAAISNESWRVDFNGTTDGGYKDDSGFDQQKATIKHADSFGDWSVIGALALTNLNQETAGFIEGPEAYQDDALRKTNPNPEAFRDTKSARLHARFERATQDGSIVLTPYLRYTDMRFIQHYLPGQAIEENGQESVGLQSARYFEHWTVGFDFELTNGQLYETQPNLTSGSPFLVETIPPGDHYDYDVTATVAALFAQRSFNIAQDIEASLGARAERVEYDYDNKMVDGRTRDDGATCGFGGCRFNRPADRTDTFTNISPKVGLTWFVNTNHQLFAFLSRGYRAPQATELYRLQGEQSVSNIDSEELDSLEIGFRGGEERFSYAASAFMMRKDNYIFRDSNRANVDNGKTSHRGVELSLDYALTERIDANVNWTYAIHQYENNPELAATPIEGNDVDTAPRNFGSANLAWQFLDGALAEIEWVHMDEYYQDQENMNLYEGHDLVNLRATMTVLDRVDAYLRITNLFDRKYAERADFAFGNDRYFVGEPRAVYVGISVDLGSDLGSE